MSPWRWLREKTPDLRYGSFVRLLGESPKIVHQPTGWVLETCSGTECKTDLTETFEKHDTHTTSIKQHHAFAEDESELRNNADSDQGQGFRFRLLQRNRRHWEVYIRMKLWVMSTRIHWNVDCWDLKHTLKVVRRHVLIQLVCIIRPWYRYTTTYHIIIQLGHRYP